jgi:hypothetical protein
MSRRPWMWGERYISIWHPDWIFSEERLHEDIQKAISFVLDTKGKVHLGEGCGPYGPQNRSHLGDGVFLFAKNANGYDDIIQAIRSGTIDKCPNTPSSLVEHIICDAVDARNSLNQFFQIHPALIKSLPEAKVTIFTTCEEDGVYPVRVDEIYTQSQLNYLAQCLADVKKANEPFVGNSPNLFFVINLL